MTILNIKADDIYVSEVLHEENQVILSMKPMSLEQAMLIKQQIVQLSWRPHAMIKSLENIAKRIKNKTQPQNFKAYDMLLAEAEEIRVLLRCCQMAEPKTTIPGGSS